MAEDTPVPPSLPSDLERQIFELTALSRPVSILSLMRVAYRVKHWVEPLLYRTLVSGVYSTIDGIPSYTAEDFTHIVRTKSAAFLHDSVRNLLVYSVPEEHTKAILLACSGIENLWILPPPSSPNGSRTAVDFMSLRHLHLIHLELFDGLNDEDEDVASWTGIRALPHLTHLSLDTYRHLALVPHLLDAWPRNVQSWRKTRAFVAMQLED
ncbi:hypothetical protein DFH09DRAFT_1331835 [Mycena vulgaris]|nr:hypothetical protein DFH09DRAFT_1331835 [Mycena vulgaris]